jgi:methyl-accepting chemotaxis protein
MIPVFKIFSILAKTFTKPAAKLLKTLFYQKGSVFRGQFIWFGNKLYVLETRINRAFLGVKSPSGTGQNISVLPDDAAFENASSFILEVLLVYGILLYIAIQEVLKGMEDKKKMKNDLEDLKDGIMVLKQELITTVERNHSLEETLKAIQESNKGINDGIAALQELSQAQHVVAQQSQESFRLRLIGYQKELDTLREDYKKATAEKEEKEVKKEVESDESKQKDIKDL